MSGTASSQILVVEDEPSLRRGVCRLVEQAGHRVLEAGSLAEARERLELGGVDALVLDLPAKLTPAEFELMKRHTVEGAKMLSAVPHPFFERAALVALRHHERWDGSGYPNGLRGEQCPLEARIVAIADVYDALGQARCYKPAWAEP